MMKRINTKTIALAGVLLALAGAAKAQDNAPLIDLLVKKGIVNDQEGEELKAELVKNFAATTSAGKLSLGSAITELKLSGDVRVRHQEEDRNSEALPTTNQWQRRERVRLRFALDATLQQGWAAGFAFQTAQAADSGNQTFSSGQDNYGMYLSRAYVSYKPNKDLFLTAGKFKNPMYSTDMVWDTDINPQGAAETYTYNIGGASGKDTLEFRAGQFWMQDVTEWKNAGPKRRDAILFHQQAVYSLFFGAKSADSLVIAPGFFAYTASDLSGGAALGNETPFNGTARHLKVITLPGELNFANVAGEGTSLKAYWDFAYNTEADNRLHKAYGIASTTKWKSDPTAWLVGVGYGYGLGKLAGDYSVKLDYRSLGIGSIDPNTSDSDFGFGNLNQEGVKLSTSYNVTDFASFGVNYFHTTAAQKGLITAVSSLRGSDILQIDLNVKF